MATNFGTNSVLDSLAAFDAQNVFDYGEDRLFDDFQRSLDAHNALVQDMVSPFVEFTTDRMRRYGVTQRIDMIAADEYTRADAEKVGPQGVNIGFPLKNFQISLQWTRKYLQVATVGELRVAMVAAQEADVRRVQAEIQRAIFTATNNLNYVDRMIDGLTLPVRALLNADGAAIPDDMFGNSFDGSTHTHYLATASLTAADIVSLINTVVEHGVEGNMRLYINRAQETAIRGFSNFTAYMPVLTNPGPGSTADQAIGPREQPFNVYNRAIGVWDGTVEVWVKPWVLANYQVAVDEAPQRRALAFRTRENGANLGALNLAVEDEKYPLRARTMEREFGVGVYAREQAAVLFNGSGTYASPTIA